MSTLPDHDLQSAVTAEFLALADLLDGLTEAGWDSASLCAGWCVREVVAHMSMPARYSMSEFQAELQKCDFDFTRLSNTVASRDAALPTSVLIGNLRDDVMHRWIPPGGGQTGALNHVVIHGLDGTDNSYMHLAQPSPFRQGDKVFTGQQIGVVGETGDATACHLHFEIWTAPGWYNGGKAVDPLPSLQAWDAFS